MNGIRISKRRVSMAAVVSGVLFTGLLVGALVSASASASGGGLRHSGGRLTNGQAIEVSGRNLNPGDEIVLIECLRTATNLTGCDPTTATVPPVPVDANGKLPPTTVTVATGNVGTGTCGTSASDVASCMIAAEDLSSPTTLTTFVAYVNIRFAKPVATTTTSLTIPSSVPSIPTSLPSIPITIPSIPAGSAPTLSVRQ